MNDSVTCGKDKIGPRIDCGLWRAASRYLAQREV